MAKIKIMIMLAAISGCATSQPLQKDIDAVTSLAQYVRENSSYTTLNKSNKNVKPITQYHLNIRIGDKFYEIRFDDYEPSNKHLPNRIGAEDTLEIRVGETLYSDDGLDGFLHIIEDAGSEIHSKYDTARGVPTISGDYAFDIFSHDRHRRYRRMSKVHQAYMRIVQTVKQSLNKLGCDVAKSD